jgi:hypothetical protein
VNPNLAGDVGQTACIKGFTTLALKSPESSNPRLLYQLEPHSNMMFAAIFIVLATGLATLVGAAPTEVKVRLPFPFVTIRLALTQAMLA